MDDRSMLQNITEPSLRERVTAMLFHIDWCLGMGTSPRTVSQKLQDVLETGLRLDWIDVKRLIPRLPALDRQVLTLVGFYGYPQRDAAVMLHISQQAVHKRMVRSIDHLVRELGGD